MGNEIEIKRVGENEYWIGSQGHFPGDDRAAYANMIRKGNLVETAVFGKSDENFVIEFIKAVHILDESVEGKLNVLVDLDKSKEPTSGARKKWLELGNRPKANKIALFGLHPVARVIASFVIGVSRNENLRFFKNREEALAWLKG